MSPATLLRDLLLLGAPKVITNQKTPGFTFTRLSFIGISSPVQTCQRKCGIKRSYIAIPGKSGKKHVNYFFRGIDLSIHLKKRTYNWPKPVTFQTGIFEIITT